MKRIKAGDKVVVTAGRDKGKEGEVMRVLDDNCLLVKGVNLVKKHQKPNPNLEIAGGIIEKEAKIHVSNVSLQNPVTGKADRVGFKYLEAEEGEKPKKVRYFKSNDEIVDVA